MRKLILLSALTLFAGSLWAQLPQKMSYQAVIRNSADKLLVNQQIGMQISILQSSASGMAAYVETHQPTTNANGLVSLEIGTGTPTKGTFASIDWPNGPFFIKTETDPYGGTNYTIVSISQLLTVPYAFHAATAETVIGGVSEKDPVFSQSQAALISAADINNLDNLSGINTGDQNLNFLATRLELADSTAKVRTEIPDVSGFLRTENDPVFAAWNKSNGISIMESQIIDLDHFTNADETDPMFANDSSYIKEGIRSWNGSLAKNIYAADTTRWGLPETDPYFNTWDKSTGIAIRENQIIDLDHFINSDESDQVYSADSALLKTGVRSWNESLAKKISEADTTRWGLAETDPLFNTWDKSTGIAITESQITDLDHFINSDETDQIYTADSALLKTGVRSWNESLAKKITEADTTRWGLAETDPLFESSAAAGITEADITNWDSKTSFNGNYSSLTNAPDLANSTLAKSITLDAGGSLTVRDATYTIAAVNQSTGMVGIGRNVTNPRASLEVGGVDGILSTGTANSGTVRALGAGMRFHWYPRKGAFRVGMAESNWWDDDGTSNPKLALYSIAMGYQPRASGVASVGIGAYNKATGDYALSLGSYSWATGSHSIAIGTQVNASGIYSIAMGAGADTNYKDGSMVVGDDTYFQTAYATADNQLTMRFSGGYRFWTSYPDSVAGVYMRHGQSGWSNYCDRNRKEHFKTLDYEEILGKIKTIPVTQWNYRGIDSLDYIGPMAQDFYAAFPLNGSDSLGINSISMDGVTLAAVRGLIDRTDQLKAALDELKIQKEKVARLEAMVEEQNAILREFKRDLSDMKSNRAK